MSYADLDAYIDREPHEGAALARGLARLSIERALDKDGPENGYLVLVGNPEGPEDLPEWYATHRAELNGSALATTAMDAARLRHRVGVEPDLEFADSLAAACSSIERLSLAGHLASIVFFDAKTESRLEARLSHDAAARMRSAQAGPPQLTQALSQQRS